MHITAVNDCLIAPVWPQAGQQWYAFLPFTGWSVSKSSRSTAAEEANGLPLVAWAGKLVFICRNLGRRHF